VNTNINPLLSSRNELFGRLNMLYGLLFHLESQLNSFRELLMHQLEESDIDLAHMAAGSALVIRDLTEWPEDGWTLFYPTGSFVSLGEEYLQVINVLLSRESAWAISQGYEAFETFLKDVTATYLWKHPEYADSKELVRQFSRLEKSKLERNDVEYWKKFVRLAYRDHVDLLKYLRRLAPELSEAEQRNNRVIDLSAWFAVLSEVRHATTHSNLLIKPARMRSWSEGKRGLLTRYFPGKATNAGYELCLGRQDAKTACELLGEYAFAILKCLSKRQNYEWTMLLRSSGESPA